MSDSETPSYYAILPAKVRYDKNLTLLQRLLYAEITALTNKEGYCWASNRYFANLYGKSAAYISQVLSGLEKKGYLDIVIDQASGNQRAIYLIEKEGYRKTNRPYIEKPIEGYIEKSIHNTIEKNTIINILSKDKSDTVTEKKEEYGNPDINIIVTSLKEMLKLPMLDGTIAENRRYAKLLIQKFGSVPIILQLIDAVRRDEFWRSNVTSAKDLYYKGVKISQQNGNSHILQSVEAKVRVSSPDPIVHIDENTRKKNIETLKGFQKSFARSTNTAY